MSRGRVLQGTELKELELLENEIITKPFCKMLRDTRIQQGLSIDEAVEGANAANIDPTQLLRALGLAIKQSREERRMSRSEFSRKTGLSLGKIIRLERGLGDPPLVTEFIRISCALGMNPEALDDRVNEFHQNIGGVRKRTLRCRSDSARN